MREYFDNLKKCCRTFLYDEEFLPKYVGNSYKLVRKGNLK